MAKLNQILMICLLVFAVFAAGTGTVNGQTRDSARVSLSQRTLDGLATTFNDYAGFNFTAAELQQLQQQSALLESFEHQAFLKVAYNVLTPDSQINEELEGQALSKLLGDKELLFYVYFASASLPRPSFSVAVVNSDLAEDEIPGIEEYLAVAMQSYSEGGASIPDVMAHGIKLYLMMITSTSSFEYLGSGGIVVPDPVYVLEKDMQFISLSGVPIKLPAGSKVFFDNKDSDYGGLLKSFKLPGSSVAEVPFYWKSGSVHEGKFAGYGHWEGTIATAAWVKFYSYKGFLEPPPHCNAPPYDSSEIVTVTLGFTVPCGQNQSAELDLQSRLYEVPRADLSLPGSDGVQGSTGNGPPPPYRGANTVLKLSEAAEFVRPGSAPIFEMDCSQSVQSTDYLPPLRPFPCGLDNTLPVASTLDGDSLKYVVVDLPDGTKGVAFLYGDPLRLHVTYDDYTGFRTIVKYSTAYETWVYVETVDQSFSADADIILGWAGEVAVTVAPFALIGVNFALGAGASAAGFSTRALFVIDLSVSAVDAGLVYALTDDGQQAVHAFAAGALAAGAGTLVHKAIKAYKSGGYSPKLNAVLRFKKVESNGELGGAIKVNLTSYRSGLRSKGWGDAKINKLFDDMVESEGLTRYLLSDLERAGAWEALIDAPKVVRLNTSLLESMSKLIKYDLIDNVGGATSNHLANIHRYTANGDYLNAPMRGPYTDDPLYLPNVVLEDFEYQSYAAIVEGLQRLRATSRLETGFVFRGRTLSQSDFDRLFGPSSPGDIPIKGFVSTTKNVEVAEAFAAGTDFPGPKVRMIWNIKSNYGVDIDDLSDWGVNLGPLYHADANPPVIMIQREVLMEEGYFRKLGEPRPIMEGGVQKQDGEGNLWFEADLEELGMPIRSITN